MISTHCLCWVCYGIFKETCLPRIHARNSGYSSDPGVENSLYIVEVLGVKIRETKSLLHWSTRVAN